MTPTWANTSALISPTHIGASNSAAWITDGATLYHYNTSTNTWALATKPSTASLTDLSAAQDGSVIAVDSAGTYLYNASTWTTLYISGHSTSCATIGDVHNQVVVDSVSAIIKSVYSINTSLAAGPAKVTATASLGDLWGITSAGAVYQYNFTTAAWVPVTGKTLTQIHASRSTASTLQIVGVDTLGKGWSYSGGSWTSIITPNVGDKFSFLQAGAGYIWGILTTGAVYRGTI